MSIGKQLQDMSEGIDERYKPRFICRTQKLLDDKASETHNFLDASLTFQEGNAVWEQDFPIWDIYKSKSHTNPLMNPKIHVQSVEHAYGLLKEYYSLGLFRKKDFFRAGIADLERYCKD